MARKFATKSQESNQILIILAVVRRSVQRLTHFRSLAPRQHSCEGTSPLATLRLIWPGPGIEPQTSRTASFNHYANKTITIINLNRGLDRRLCFEKPKIIWLTWILRCFFRFWFRWRCLCRGGRGSRRRGSWGGGVDRFHRWCSGNGGVRTRYTGS